MLMMDEVAFIAATRFTRKRCVTVSSDRIDFKKPIPAGTIVELIGKVSKIGNTSLDVKVEIYIEQMYSNHREKAISGNFTFVALDPNNKPRQVTPVIPETEDELKHFDGALRRRQLRLILGGKMKPDDAVELKALFVKEDE